MHKMQSLNRQSFIVFISDNYDKLVNYFIYEKGYDPDAAKDMVSDFALWGMERDWEAWEDARLAEGRPAKFDLIDAQMWVKGIAKDKRIVDPITKHAHVSFDHLMERAELDIDEWEDSSIEGYFAELEDILDDPVKSASLATRKLSDGASPERILLMRERVELNQTRVLDRIDSLTPMQYDIMKAIQDHKAVDDLAEAREVSRWAVYKHIERACDRIYEQEPWLRPTYYKWEKPNADEREAFTYEHSGFRLCDAADVPGKPHTERRPYHIKYEHEGRYWQLLDHEKRRAALRYYRKHSLMVGVGDAAWTPGLPPVASIERVKDYTWQHATRLFNCLGVNREFSQPTLDKLKEKDLIG